MTSLTLITRAVRPRVRTFDVFDTLIARKCIEPGRVFMQVEARTGRPGFAVERVLAERAVAGAPHTLADIYDQLASSAGLTPQTRDALMQAEIDAELENVTPVAESLSLVRDGDIAVSDMYLPRDVINAMLRKAGVDRQLALIVSCDGKKTGRIWPRLLAQFEIESHLGDNAESDVQRAQEAGIVAEHFVSTAPDFVERWLVGADARDLGEVTRMARLATWSPDPVMRELQLLQTRLNFPLMVLSTILLLRHMERNEIRNVLFCSRDCNLWIELFQVFRKHLGLSVDACYFHTSREARVRPSAGYLEYVRSCLGGKKSVVVDIAGTGWSLSHLFEALGETVPVYLLHRLSPVGYTGFEFAQQAEPPACILDNSDTMPTYNNTFLEMLNYAAHPQVMDVLLEEGQPVPVFKNDRLPEQVSGYIDAQRGAFLTAVRLLDANFLRETLEMSDLKLTAAISELYRHVNDAAILRTVYAMHRKEEPKTRASLMLKMAQG